MKRREKNVEATDPSTISSIRSTRNISVREAKIFWQNQRKEGNIDVIFKEVQSNLQLLCQKIKDGSATNKDYLRARILVNEASLEDYEACHSDFAEKVSEDEDSSPVKTEEPYSISISSEVEETLRFSEPEPHDDVMPPFATSVLYAKHSCGQMCLSNVNPYFSKRENPLRFPVMCHFQRRRAKSSLGSRHDVIYKAPCGKSLRDFDDVRSYLFQTKCRFLSLDHFSFNTNLQLDRNLVKNQVVFQEADISKDAELVPVPFCNEIDDTRPAPFTYRKSSWPRGYSINNFTDLFLGCCDCTDGCLDVTKCTCLQLTASELGTDVTSPKRGRSPGYKYKRLPSPVPTGLYECNVSCKCNRKMCQNRVVQHGLQVRLQVFKTRGKGWGLRCLDDLDKGTFVCIYAGRILMKTVGQDSVVQADAKEAASISVPKKRCCSHSDSEITVSSSVSSISHNFRNAPLLQGSSLTELKSKSLGHIRRGKLDFTCIKRPKTRTSILQKRRRELVEEGAVTMQHSSDDEPFTPPASPKVQHPGGHEDKDESVEVVHTRGNIVWNDKAGYVSDESSSSVQCASTENSDSTDSNTEEMIFFLDASTEGNVGRFLNHSCSPNLFVQHVFVETHSKKFPWVAFFTKSFIKAGTELTWEYNYDIGSTPEREIPCLCGHNECKNVIV
ncbi:histone-lysine N-methyltransferase SETDB2 [Bufo gargarizans]|uniref:histone-lysine N-methyltransferase SETDB2 n=1 Tax=Bufo gargarizans TaxID=30331 RepID=UPI001CF1BE07|nr:histone-lysine N-methyltransferase SETDB2 [Bufo gargarizans]XP_044142349.1 histone-lysine N-methyltransferase SETDB2 [Bufo gargarizans]XP_044142350.1 histone-lysine N-methyltransferase SETDB2 [Bufo gargarizans]